MKKIAILVPSLAIGGCEKGACNISFALKDKYEVYMVMLNGKDIHYDFYGTPIDMNLEATPNPVKKIFNTFARAIKMKKLIKEYKFDYVLSFLGPNHLINYINYKNTKKYVSCIGFGYLKKHFDRYVRMIEKSEGIIFNSCYMQGYFDKMCPHLKNKTYTVQNVFDIDMVKNASMEETEESFTDFVNTHKTVVATGRFCLEKGFDNLIKAFSLVKKEIKDVGLVIVGGGALEEKLKNLSKDLGIYNDIYFTGYTDNPYKYVSKCDIFTLSSRNEGFPNVLMEAMILGLPVIATNCESGPYEILFDKFTMENNITQVTKADYGIIIPDINSPENYDSSHIEDSHYIYKDGIFMLLNSDELRNELKKASEKRSKDFTKDEITRQYVDIFEG